MSPCIDLPNSIIAAAWKFGKGKEVHQALKSAAMERGEPILQRAVALKIACEASGIASEALANAIDDPTLASELRESLSEFESHRIDQRPAFILRSAIGDSAVFSGIYRREPIFAALEAMLRDEEKYEEHALTHPAIPSLVSCPRRSLAPTTRTWALPFTAGEQTAAGIPR